MIIGEFEGKLTEKNRIAIPVKIREEFKEQIILSRGYEGCLILLDKSRWDNLIKTISIEPILDLSVRDTKRFLLGGAYRVDLDKQGRFVLPENLKKYAKIENNIIFLGLEEWVEIWDKDLWGLKLKDLTKSAGDIAEQLIKLK